MHQQTVVCSISYAQPTCGESLSHGEGRGASLEANQGLILVLKILFDPNHGHQTREQCPMWFLTASAESCLKGSFQLPVNKRLTD